MDFLRYFFSSQRHTRTRAHTQTQRRLSCSMKPSEGQRNFTVCLSAFFANRHSHLPTPTILFLRPHALPLTLLSREIVRQPKSSKEKKKSE